LVAGSAEEHLGLGLDRRLDDQPGAEAGDVLDHLASSREPSNWALNLAADTVGGK